MEHAGDPLSPPEQLELIRLIISCMRAAANIASAAQPARDLEAAACRVIALQAQRPVQQVFSLWCGWRVVSLRKLRAHIARGDKSETSERLSALEWSIVDLLLLYDMAILSEASYVHQQLEALERTFQLVQRLQLEPADAEQWQRAAQSYSCNNVQLSAVALQRRWHELKLDARRRACGTAATAPPMLELHKAITSTYPHVVTSELPSWRELVSAGKAAEPTPVPRLRPEVTLRATSEPSTSVAEKNVNVKTTRSTHGKDGEMQDCSNKTPLVPDRRLAGPSNTSKQKSKKIKHLKKGKEKELFKLAIQAQPGIKEKEDVTTYPKADVVNKLNKVVIKVNPGTGVVKKTPKADITKKLNRVVSKVNQDIKEVEDDTPTPKADVVKKSNIVVSKVNQDITEVEDDTPSPQADVMKKLNIVMSKVNQDIIEVGDDTPTPKADVVKKLNRVETKVNQDIREVEDDTPSPQADVMKKLNIVVSKVNKDIREIQDDTPNPKADVKELNNAVIKVKPEINEIYDDTINPKADVVKAMTEIDVSNVDATIVYESDGEDVKTIFDVQMGVDKDEDIAKNGTDSENVNVASCSNNPNKIAEMSKGKVNKSNVDDMPCAQNIGDSLITDYTEDLVEEPLNIVITNVWSEKGVENVDVRKDRVNNITESRRDSTDSENISVGSELDYGSNYLAIKIAQYLGIWDLTQIDPKLLMTPVVSLKRITPPSLQKPPPTPHSHIEQYQQSLRPTKSGSSYSQLFFERNKEGLRKCKPCEVSVRRLAGEKGETGEKGGKGRRVELPDMETVRQNNRGILTAEVAPLVAEPPKAIKQYGPARIKRARLDTTDNNQSPESTIILEKNPQCLTPPPLTQTLDVPQKPLNNHRRWPKYDHPFLPVSTHYQFNLTQKESLLQDSQYTWDKGQCLNVLYKDFISNSIQLTQRWPQDTTHTNKTNIQDTATQNISPQIVTQKSQNIQIPNTQSTDIATQNISPQIATQKSQNLQIPNTKSTDIETQNISPQIATQKSQNIQVPNTKLTDIVSQHIPPQIATQTAQNIQQPTTTTNYQQCITMTQYVKSITQTEGVLLKRIRTPEPCTPTLTPKQEPVEIELTPITNPEASSSTLDPTCAIYSELYPQMGTANDIKLAVTITPVEPTLGQSLNPSAPLSYANSAFTTPSQTNLASEKPLLESSTPIPNAPNAFKLKSEPKSRSPSPVKVSSLKLEPSAPIPSEFVLKTPKTEPKSRTPSPKNLPSLTTSSLEKSAPVPRAPPAVKTPKLEPKSRTPSPVNITSLTLLQTPIPHALTSTSTLALTSRRKPSPIKTYTKKRSVKKAPIKPCILGFALKQNMKRPVILNLRPNTSTQSVPSAPTPRRSEDNLTDEDERDSLLWEEEERELRENHMPWRAQVEDDFCEPDEFDLGMTFAEAFFLYGETDKLTKMRIVTDDVDETTDE